MPLQQGLDSPGDNWSRHRGSNFLHIILSPQYDLGCLHDPQMVCHRGHPSLSEVSYYVPQMILYGGRGQFTAVQHLEVHTDLVWVWSYRVLFCSLCVPGMCENTIWT